MTKTNQTQKHIEQPMRIFGTTFDYLAYMTQERIGWTYAAQRQ